MTALTAVSYQDDILRPVVRPFASAVGPGFLLGSCSMKAVSGQ